MSIVLALDLEMNQPSGKIIQIRYVIADLSSLRVFEKKRLYVNPQEPLGIIPEMNIPISQYTGITEDHIKQHGMTLQEAYQIMCSDVLKYNPTRTVVQWGGGSVEDGIGSTGDADYLRQQLGLKWTDYIFRQGAWDVKNQYQIYQAFNRKKVVAGVEKALKTMDLEFEGRPHDALDDAWNTFRIFTYLGNKMVQLNRIEQIIKKPFSS